MFFVLEKPGCLSCGVQIVLSSPHEWVSSAPLASMQDLTQVMWKEGDVFVSCGWWLYYKMLYMV